MNITPRHRRRLRPDPSIDAKIRNRPQSGLAFGTNRVYSAASTFHQAVLRAGETRGGDVTLSLNSNRECYSQESALAVAE